MYCFIDGSRADGFRSGDRVCPEGGLQGPFRVCGVGGGRMEGRRNGAEEGGARKRLATLKRIVVETTFRLSLCLIQ